MTDSVTLNEEDVKKVITEWIERTKGKKVRNVYVSYDRPSNPSPVDYGIGLSIQVILTEEIVSPTNNLERGNT